MSQIIERLDASQVERDLERLGEILAAVVESGASVGFVTPFPAADATTWWRTLLPAVRAGQILVLGAWVNERLVGTAQLRPSPMPNGRHRAEVAKLMVDPAAQRQGIATALMREVESLAREIGRTTLVLDTETGSGAQLLYSGLGWAEAGVIPAFAILNDRSLCSTTYMYRLLD